jgi:hypothetical protein
MVATASALVAKRGERLFVELASTTSGGARGAITPLSGFWRGDGGAAQRRSPVYDVDEFDDHVPASAGARFAQSWSRRRLHPSPDRCQCAARMGRFYSASEFELDASQARLNGRLLEVGRTCIAPEFRQGAAIAVLWSGLAGFIHLQRLRLSVRLCQPAARRSGHPGGGDHEPAAASGAGALSICMCARVCRC